LKTHEYQLDLRRSRSWFATPTETFKDHNNLQTVSDGVANPVTPRCADDARRLGGSISRLAQSKPVHPSTGLLSIAEGLRKNGFTFTIL
jgi:hypothetical protein